jgi:3-oxoacyl-(acyl-carrier-protein) synthase
MKDAVVPSVFIVGGGCLAASGYGPAQLERVWTDSSSSLFGKLRLLHDFDPAQYLTMKGLRSLSQTSRMCCVAAAAALGPAPSPDTHHRYGVVVGTQWGSLESLVDFNRRAFTEGPHLVNPSQFPNVIGNVHGSYLGILFGFGGPNITLCGRAGGLEAIGQGADLVSLGRADLVLAGGVETIGPTLLRGVAKEEHDGVQWPPGEGAAFVLLSPQPHPYRPAQAQVLSWSQSTVHQEQNAEAARVTIIQDVMKRSGIDPGIIRTVWYAGEPPESVVQRRGGLSPGVIMQTLHTVTGNCRAADGALAVALAAFRMAQNKSPVLITVFPSYGSQVAMLLGPA